MVIISTHIKDIADIIILIGNTYHSLRLSMSLGISMGIYYTNRSTTWAKGSLYISRSRKTEFEICAQRPETYEISAIIDRLVL